MKATSGSGTTRSVSDAATNARRRAGLRPSGCVTFFPKREAPAKSPNSAQQAAREARSLAEAFRGAQLLYSNGRLERGPGVERKRSQDHQAARSRASERPQARQQFQKGTKP